MPTIAKTVPTIHEKPLLKVTQVAGRLSTSRAFIYQLMDRGELPYIQLGGTRRVRQEDVDRLVAENTVTAK